ncbi:hydroxyacylglutathione hydrolase [Crenobacter cavernae]|uniref:Hydroxyacylglutathione hydrolase n=1 Tax=Crenobacter cavernae TaxID=2290923 RepID=A0A345Y9W8_9NEIS|nr:hydroxyacylglutathione hydrolase [Crenobacter cavernae]AXK40720.1 hydroxyacylglutathione hydrolase [Crenobacter cavernae]
MITVSPVCAFNDNYIWVLQRAGGAVAVDPGESAPVARFLAEEGLHLEALLITHHHGDHTGGIAALAAAHPGLVVYGPPGIRGVTHPVTEGDVVTVLGQRFDVIAVPGHTLDHIAYSDGTHLFCGDTLFGAGCGRVFEGTPAMLHQSLQKLAALPDATLAYPAHEYTLSNLAFAAAADPDNPAVAERIARDQARRARGEATLPTPLAEEKRSNPFLRSADPALAAGLEKRLGQRLDDEVSVFTALRDWKNRF